MAGVPLAPVMAFWVASPTMDPEVFALSVGMLGWPLAMARLLATLALSLGAGYLTLALVRSGLLGGKVLRRGVAEKYGDDDASDGEGCCEDAAPREPALVAIGTKPTAVAGATGTTDTVEAEACGVSGCGTARAPEEATGWWRQAADSVREIDRPRFAKEVLAQSWFLGRWLLLAFAIEALILFHVPQETIAGVLGGGNAFAVPLAALVGLPLYLNEFGALPIVAGLLDSGMSPGAAIAFLIAGPVTTIPAMAAVWGMVRPRVFFLYVGVGLGGAVLLGSLTDIVL